MNPMTLPGLTFAALVYARKVGRASVFDVVM